MWWWEPWKVRGNTKQVLPVFRFEFVHMPQEKRWKGKRKPHNSIPQELSIMLRFTIISYVRSLPTDRGRTKGIIVYIPPLGLPFTSTTSTTPVDFLHPSSYLSR